MGNSATGSGRGRELGSLGTPLASALGAFAGSLPVLAAFALGGCSHSQVEAHKVSWTTGSRQHLGFRSAAGELVEARKVTFQGNWQVEEYVRVLAEDLEGELYLTFTPRHEKVSLAYSLTLQDFVDSWNLNRDRPKEWLTAGRFYRRPATFFYRRFRLQDANRECVGYTANWRPKADDPKFRPSRLSFGYFCLAPGVALSANDAEGLLRRIEIRLDDGSGHDRLASGTVVAGEIPPPCLQQTTSGGEGALDFARGVPPCNAAGNTRFPFKFAMHYNVTNGMIAR